MRFHKILNKDYTNCCKCLTHCDPLNCSPPGSSVCGIFQARILERVAIFLLQGIFPTQGSNPLVLYLLYYTRILEPLSQPGSPSLQILEKLTLDHCCQSHCFLEEENFWRFVNAFLPYKCFEIKYNYNVCLLLGKFIHK